MNIEAIFEKLEEENQNAVYAITKYLEGKYKILPNTIAEGKVLKIHYKDDLESEEGYEQGLLILTPNSGIKKHVHTEDIEKYTLLYGILSIDGIKVNQNICLIGEEHGIDKVPVLTIIKTTKISKKILNQKKKTLSN